MADLWQALSGTGADEEPPDNGEAEISFGRSGGGRVRVGQCFIVPRLQVWGPKGNEPEELGIAGPSERRDFDSGSFFYWPVTAQEAGTRFLRVVRPDSKFGPSEVVLLEMPASTFLNWPPDAGDPRNVMTNIEISRSFPVPGPAKNDNEAKRRWRGVSFHLMFLPSLVQGVAVAAGMMPKQVYDYGQLTTIEEADEELYARLVGPDKDTPGELVEARAAIWAALGEDKVAKWSADSAGRTTNVAPNSHLHRIIRHTLYRTVPEKLWCELAAYTVIPDPAAVDKNGKSQLAPVFLRIWQTEAEASSYAKTVYPDTIQGTSMALPKEFANAGITESNFISHLGALLKKPIFVGKSVDEIVTWLRTDKGEKWVAAEGMQDPEVAEAWIRKVLE